MNKNTIIGIVLMVALFIGFGIYQAHVLEEQQEYEQKVKEQKEAEAAMQYTEAEAARMQEEAMSMDERRQRDSTILANENARIHNLYGDNLLAALEGVSQRDTLQNDFMSVVFDTKGGKIVDVTLKEHTRYAEGERTELVKLMDPASASFGIDLYRNGNEDALKTNDFYFTPQIEKLDDSYRVTMTLNTDPGAYVQYVYTLYHTGDASRDHVIDFTLNTSNIDQYLDAEDEIILRWGNKSLHNERNFDNENAATTVAYYLNEDEEIEELDANLGNKGREHHRNLGWIALKQQYFSSVLMAEDPIHAGMGYKTWRGENKKEADYVKEYDTRIIIPHEPNSTQVDGNALNSYDFAFYYGPNDYTIMKNVEFAGKEQEIEDLIPMGGWLIGWFNKFLTIPVFQWLKDHGLNFGLIILILTLMVKLIILPLTYKSYMSTAKMRAVRPELEEINKKYPDPNDAMKKQQATMELYQKAGISPMGGCLPLLIQMPILWAMFRFFPASIELRGESFLWADDLSSYDSVVEFGFNIPFYGDHVSLFALLMALSIFGYSFYTYKQQAASTAGQPGAGMMKFMMVYFMPVMMLCVMNSFSSGLCYYYFLSQILTMIIMYVIRRSVNDEKVRERLLAHAARPRKKSRFQERYEEALRQQQETLNREQRRQRR